MSGKNEPPEERRLLTESECKDLIRQMNFTMRRVEEIRPYLVPESVLTEYINRTCADYNEQIKVRLVQYQNVMIQHIIFALRKLERGVLCVDVFNRIKSTPMDVIMRGLLNPADFRSAEEYALEKAISDAEIFQRNVEFFCQVIRKGNISSTVDVKKYTGMKTLRDHFSEFQHAKNEYERVQEELEAEREAAEEEERERREKEMKMKKLGR